MKKSALLFASFAAINWSDDLYFIKTETDPKGGTEYSITGTSQLLSVPYALHSKTTEGIKGTKTLAIGDSYLGGKIFWLDETGMHGLVVAPSELKLISWSNGTKK